MARGKLAVWAAVLVWSVGLQAQPVYKWVDANGKTHYGSQPPADKDDAAPMKLQGTNGTTTGSASGPAGSGGGNSKQVPMNCAVAVSNIHYQADLMLEVGQKNVRDGYMTQAAFDTTAPKIREAKGKYSVGDCQSSSGNKKSFYQCMSSSNNHVTGCDRQFKH